MKTEDIVSITTSLLSIVTSLVSNKAIYDYVMESGLTKEEREAITLLVKDKKDKWDSLA